MLAISDHDTVAGLDEAITAGALHHVQIVPAIEISAVDDGSPVPLGDQLADVSLALRGCRHLLLDDRGDPRPH